MGIAMKKKKSRCAAVEMANTKKRQSSTIRKDSTETAEIEASTGTLRKISGPMKKMKTKGRNGARKEIGTLKLVL